jgi:predicted CXXCH cytochrome family protein
MKKSLVFFVSVLLSTGLFAAISGSAHDFSGSGWTPDGRICVACHTPHNAMTSVTNAPIWNHTVTVAVFTMYNTTYAGTDPDAVPTDQSKLCLSCHDGVTAMDAFGGVAGSTPMGAITANVTTDLQDDHPISITYLEANALKVRTGPSGVTGGTTIEADMLFGGKVECSSCHDVHNKYGIARLLKKANTGSALCLTCHDK